MGEIRRAYAVAECGHLLRYDVVYESCPYCDDYAEAIQLDRLEELLEEQPSRVVPHTRS